MHNTIFLSDSYFAELPVRKPKVPRDRFVKYYQDLYALHEMPLSSETFLSGSQYSYAELGNKVLEKYAETKQLKNIDLLHIVTWAHEFDPDYASAGTYLVDKFKLKCLVYDIGDQGTLSFFTSVDLVKKYLYSSQLKNALILVMEQTCIPRDKSSNVLPPLNDFAFGLIVSNDIEEKNKPHIYQIISSGVLTNTNNKSLKQISAEIIKNKVDLNENISLICKKPGMIQQKYETDKSLMPKIQLKTILDHPGNYTFFTYLRDLLEKYDETENVLMVDEDVETMDIGYLLLRRNSHASCM